MKKESHILKLAHFHILVVQIIYPLHWPTWTFRLVWHNWASISHITYSFGFPLWPTNSCSEKGAAI